MLIDDFGHEHLAVYVRMQAVCREDRRQIMVGWVIEEWLQVDAIGLLTNVGIDSEELFLPVRVGFRAEGCIDVFRLDGHECEENRTNIVCFTFFTDGIEICNDFFGISTGITKTVGAGQYEQIVGAEGQDIRIEALQGGMRDIAALPEVDRRKIQIGRIAVFQIDR